MRKIFLPLLLVFVSLTTFAQDNIIDEVIAVVGDNAILKSEIEQQYQQALSEGVTYPGDIKCHIFEQSLIQSLMLNQADLDSVEVSQNEIVNQVDGRMNYMIQQIGDKKKLEEYFNKSIIQIKREMMETVHKQMLAQRMQGEITKNIKVTPSEIRTYFKSLPEDSIPMVATQYELNQIVLYPRVQQEEIDRVKAQLREFQKEIKEGRDFATLAVLYSEDPGSAARGGDLGWMTRSQLIPEFASVAFNLTKKNKVSKIVETEYGFHIIQLIDRKGDRINVRHILIKPKISDDARKEALNKLDTIRNFINDGKLSFEEAALRFSMDKDTRANGGVMVNPNTGNTKFEIGDIPPQMNKQIATLKPGEVSLPFKMMDEQKGKETYRLVLLKSKTDPHRANLRDDYQLLKGMLENKKRQEKINNWIKEKQSTTYIKIDKKWLNCDFEYKGWVK
jgi:peptidyl-prolyl cis-trans isomerase SurA